MKIIFFVEIFNSFYNFFDKAKHLNNFGFYKFFRPQELLTMS